MKYLLNNLLEFLLNLIFPRRCIVCGHFGSWICAKCRVNATPYLKEVEGKPVLIMHSFIKGGVIREMLHYLKYDSIFEMAKLMIESDLSPPDCFGDLFSESVLLPVPVSKQTLKLRGYNQSLLIAKNFSGIWNIPVMDSCVIKNQKYKSQVGSSKRDRLKIGSPFKVIKKISKPVIVVDDVLTTGATMSTLIRELVKSGFEVLGGIVVASGSKNMDQ